jgi:beta-glucosidase
VTPFDLPEDFLIGTATASLQIEGGDRNNSWFRWAEQGHIKDGSHCIVADDHWNRVPEDIELMKRLNVNAYRMSIEWSRIEPEEGRFDPVAMRHYRDEIERLLSSGIRPMVTLHHFSNPLWMEDDGGWTSSRAVDRFVRYAEEVVRGLGDLVGEWVTINEPNIYLLFGYLLGMWPPGKQSFSQYFRGIRTMISAHLASFARIHELYREVDALKEQASEVQVGLAHHLRIFDPSSRNLADKMTAAMYEYIAQGIYLRGTTLGRLPAPLIADRRFRRAAQAARREGREREARRLIRERRRHAPFGPKGLRIGGAALSPTYTADFIGVNYYSRDMISFDLNKAVGLGRLSVRKGAPRSDLGWEIYPEGLYRILVSLHRKFGLPIYITENGTCDAEDAFRARYIYDHLYQVYLAKSIGIDVRGYYHWTLMDNFEWVEGESARFGLYEVDFATQERRLRESGRMYAEIARDHGVSRAIIDRYLAAPRF